MTPPAEFAMVCQSCRKPWLRIGNTPTLCPFCGSIETVARRVEGPAEATRSRYG